MPLRAIKAVDSDALLHCWDVSSKIYTVTLCRGMLTLCNWVSGHTVQRNVTPCNWVSGHTVQRNDNTVQLGERSHCAEERDIVQLGQRSHCAEER